MQSPASKRKTEAARQRLESQGLSIAAFARLHGLNRHVVSDVLCGRVLGKYGDGHKAAVALGIKRASQPTPEK